MRKWIVGIVVLLLIGGTGLFAAQRLGQQGGAPNRAETSNETPAIPVQVAEVQRGVIERTVEISGTVVSARDVRLSFKIPGKVAAVLVKEGERVSTGQALAVLETAELSIQVDQAKANLQAAEARYRLLLAGSRAEERAQAESLVKQAENQARAAEQRVVQAETALQLAETDLRRAEQLFNQGAVAEQIVEQARGRYRSAQADLEAARAQHAAAIAQVASARQQFSMVQTGARKEEVEAAAAQVAQAKAALQLALVQLANATLRAPFSGQISDVTITIGDVVSPGIGVVALYDDSALEVKATIREADLALVKPGQLAVVSLFADPGQTRTGKVRLIVPSADPTSRAAEVRIVLESFPKTAVPGTSARGQILTERRTDALLIPASALRLDGRTFVYVVVDGVVQIRPVTVGLRHDHVVEIQSGLHEGEQVVVLGPETLVDGARVRVVK